MEKNTVNPKNKRFTAIAWALAILVLAVAIPLNLIFERLNVNFDMTANGLYTLTQTTEDYLNELDSRGEKVDVYFLATMEELESDLECLALYRMVLAYDKHPCFNLIALDPDTNPDTLKKLNPEGQFNLSDADFIFVHDKMIKRLPFSMTYFFELDENGKTINAEFCAENYFTGYMKTVVDGELPTVYFLEGHGEHTLEDMSRLKANLSNYNYGTSQLNLTTALAVPDDCCILVIAGPERDITADEFDKIREYTEKGGNVSLFLDPNSSKEVYTNLERLLSGYCIGINYDKVTETDENRHSHKKPYAMMCDIVEASGASSTENLTAALLPTKTDTVTYMPESRSFYLIYGENIGSLQYDTLIETDTTAISEPFGGTKLDPESSTGQQIPLAMYAMDTQHADSKLVVFGSSYFITDEGAGNAYFINPLQLFLSTITWMYNSDVDMDISNKARSFDSLNINSSAEATGMLVLFVGFPVLIAMAGVIIWLRRKDG